MKKNRKYLSIFVLILAIGICYGVGINNNSLSHINDKTDIISLTGCKFDLTKINAQGFDYSIIDGNNTNSNKTNQYTCKYTDCSIKVKNWNSSTFSGLAGDGNCYNGGHRGGTENGQIWCASPSGVTPQVCSGSKPAGSQGNSSGNSSNSTSFQLNLGVVNGGTSTALLGNIVSGATTYRDQKTAICNSSSCKVKINATAASGYKFRVWSKDSKCSDENYEVDSRPNTEFTFTKNTSLYACFEKTSASASNNSFELNLGVVNGGTSTALLGNIVSGATTYRDQKTAICNSSSCKVKINATAASGYKFRVWSKDSKCSDENYEVDSRPNTEFTFTKNTSLYACFEKTSASAGNNSFELNLGVVNGGTSTALLGNIVSGATTYRDQKTAICNSSSCKVKINATAASGYKFRVWSKDSKCSDENYEVDSRPNTEFTFTKNTSLYACFEKDNGSSTDLPNSGGTPTPPPTTSPIVTEPIVQDKFTVNVNSYVWAKGKEFMGNSISCGDKLYVTKCTSDNNAVCVVTSINGKNVSSTTQIYKKNYTTNESDTGCFKDITRYISEKTYSYTNSSLDSGKTEVSCGTTVVFKEAIETACTSLSCKVNINDKTVYVERDKIVSDKPACEPNKEDGTCTSSERVTDLKGVKNIKLCKKDDTEENRDKIVTCASDYEASYNLVNDKCTSTSSDNCYREYKYNCSYIKRPSLSVSAGTLGANGTGTITIYGKDNGNIGLKGYFISSGDQPTQNSDWTKFNDTSYKAYETKNAGSYFIWVLNNKNRMSYPIMAKVFDADMSTTLQTFSATDAAGNNLSMTGLDDNSVAYTGVVDSKYALLSNKLLESAEIAGFESLTTAYEINVVSNKVALYATLTSNDANYVSGYEPRTIDLDYGRNVALIKIVNNKGKERTYTFIINRIDDRDGSNLLSSLTISKGKLNFDSYVSSYDVSIPKNTKKVSINGTLVSDKAAFIQGYEPREITITEDVQSAVLKVRSESGSIRSYVVTFTRNGSDDHSEDNSTYLSSLSVPGTQLGFNKEVYDYTISVPYDTETIPIYAFGESSKAVVNISNNSGLKVGNNLVEIEVKNGNKTRIYSIHVIRKESGLDISNSNKLAMLSVKNYNINFNPDILDYVVKIKREKSLLITASPESNRADVYMVGNNDLTGFSTIRVKVIAENGLTNIYSIDIQKDPYNKTIELIAAVAGGLIFVGTAIIIVIRRKRKKMKEYLEG